jgi:hypothetical protein
MNRDLIYEILFIILCILFTERLYHFVRHVSETIWK